MTKQWFDFDNNRRQFLSLPPRVVVIPGRRSRTRNPGLAGWDQSWFRMRCKSAPRIDRVRAFLNSAVRGAPLSAGAVIAAGYARFTARLPETCAGLKVDPAALEYKDFTYVAAGWVEAGAGLGAQGLTEIR